MSFLVSKYRVAGNDFLLLESAHLPEETDLSLLARTLCQGKEGADGLILARQDPEVDVAMRIFNADGGEAEGCGNGLCALLQFLQVERTCRIRMGKRIVRGFREGDLSVVSLGIPEGTECNFAENIHFVHTGAPHLVHFVADVDGFPLKSFAEPWHREFNVNIATVKEKSLFVRTYERGVGETLSCGTGAAAVAWIASLVQGIQMPLELFFRGGCLRISCEEDELMLANRAERLFSIYTEKSSKV
ncbi:MAG: diaminopimelate epimerase [Verrucomicrobiota bacterium]|nr:diaminopimelate epimerase [Verrucomicrobiota bacterium]